MAAGEYSFTDATGSTVNLDWNPADSGAVVQLFADDDGQFANNMQFGPQQAIDSLDGSLLAELGFAGSASLGAQYALGDAYFAVELAFEGDQFAGPAGYVASLSVLDDPADMFPDVTTHDGGQDVHLFGLMFDESTGGWQHTGMGDRTSFVIPEPTSAGLIGLGGLTLLWRRRS